MFNDFETKLSPDSNWELKYVHVFKGIFIAETENEYKNGKKLCLNEQNEFSIEEKKTEEVSFYLLNIKSNKYHVMIRSNNRISLEYIIFHATLQDEKDIGRPLTFYPHLSNIESPLEEKRLKENNYRGFINLLVIALILSHLRLMWENYVKYGLLLTPSNFFKIVMEHDNFIFLSACFCIISFSVCVTFLLEKASTRFKSNSFFLFVHFINFCFLLSAPLYFHKWNIINPSKPKNIF